MSFLNNFLNKLNVASKLRLTIILASLIILSTQIMSAIDLKENMMTERKAMAKSLVESAVSLIDANALAASNSSLSEQEAKTIAMEQVKAMRFGRNGYLWINDINGIMLMNPIQPNLNGKSMVKSSTATIADAFNQFVNVARNQGSGFVNYLWPQPGSTESESKVSYVKKTANWSWVVGTGVYFSDIEIAFEEMLKSILLWTAFYILLLIVLSSIIANNIIKPLTKLTSTMNKIAMEKDLTIIMKTTGNDELSSMSRAFNDMNQDIREVISSINVNTDTLASQAEELATVTNQIQAGMALQKEETTSVAASVTQLSASADEVNYQVSTVLETTKHVRQEAEKGTQNVDENIEVIGRVGIHVKSAVNVVEKLQVSSTQIGEILEVIKQIAEQTNLLALNAAIEAARAGEQGRGFAVVADEVRTLAQRTQESTGSIQQIINELQLGVTEAVEVMGNCEIETQKGIEQANACGQALQGIQVAINELTSVGQIINDSVEQQSGAISEISNNIQKIADVSEETELGTQHTFQASQNLSEMAQELSSHVKAFKL
ncbi:MAG: methyl-accepting chemotaxis protein [Aliivibrio sp.]|uniref:methyl-accepting chemotaxis protein n=1 Tax=Aliivibrio sp. TaxID=1872443 RepID=UPI001A4D08AA|nr:methyl-accepting chemotaxis protein [Aliivibrio sp.]